jgi:phage terminase large subunit-like protein
MNTEQLAIRLINYCNDIVDGKILACKKHIWAIKRFLHDLDQSQNEDYPYELDIEELYRFYEWAKLFKYTKGDKNGEKLTGKPIELEDFQLFIIVNLFGWKHKKTGYRRFKKSYIQLARKQAKSFLLSLMTSYEAFLSGEKSEVYIAGWGLKQSHIVYKEVETQLKNCEFLKGKWSNSYHRITHLKSESIIMALSKEAKNFDGTNPSLVVIDEYHVHPTNEIYEVLESGMVRPNAHLSVITTAGLSLSGPCYTEYQFVSKLLDPDNPTENETYFALVCELDKEDDPKNEKVWIKANPLLATFPEGLETLREKLKIALDIPEKMNSFLTKNCNLWVQAKKNSYIPLDKFNDCKDENLTLEDMRGLPCIVGVDLSAKIDLTSVSFLFVQDEILYVFSHSFLPEDTLEAKRKSDNVRYDLWVEQGWMTATPGAVVDYRFVEKYIEDTERQYGFQIKEIAADPWNASQFLQNLDLKGYIPVEINQKITTLSYPTKDFRERVYQKKIKHNGNPVLAWAIGNAVTRMDAQENIMLDKSKSTERIDPIASVITAHARTTAINEIDINEHILSDDFSF